MLTGFDLFSGIGGISFALRGLVRPVGYCEIDRYARAVLLSRMADGQLHHAPVWDDMRTLQLDVLRDYGPIDILYGGFPCQDISVAGSDLGLDGERSGLFFEVLRLARQAKPKFVFLENVKNIRLKGLETVVGELADLGYDCRWCVVSSAATGKIHIRERWFLLGYAHGAGLPIPELEGVPSPPRFSFDPWPTAPKSDWIALASDMVREVHGLPFRVDRIRCLGNAVDPMAAMQAFYHLVGLSDRKEPQRETIYF